jgi:hypothetical protein
MLKCGNNITFWWVQVITSRELSSVPWDGRSLGWEVAGSPLPSAVTVCAARCWLPELGRPPSLLWGERGSFVIQMWWLYMQGNNKCFEIPIVFCSTVLRNLWDVFYTHAVSGSVWRSHCYWQYLHNLLVITLAPIVNTIHDTTIAFSVVECVTVLLVMPVVWIFEVWKW